MPLPNYSTRFNPRTGEQSYLDTATGQWTSGLPNVQNANPNAGMDLNIPALPTLNPQQIQAMYGGGGGAVGTGPAPGMAGAGAGSSSAAGTLSGGLGNGGPINVNAFKDYGPGANMTLQEANDFYANRVQSAVPQQVSPGGMPPGFPAALPAYTGGSVGFGARPNMMPSVAPAAQRTRVYGSSFNLPAYNGRNS